MGEFMRVSHPIRARGRVSVGLPGRLALAVRLIIVCGLLSSTTISPALAQTGLPTVFATVPVGNGPAGIAANSQTNRVYVANAASNTVSVVDSTRNVLVASVAVGRAPTGVAVNTATNRIFVANT